MRREVVRIITPGTATEEALLDPRAQNLIAAVNSSRDAFGLAWLELSSGRFSVLETVRAADLAAELQRLRPSELLAPEGAMPELGSLTARARPRWHFDRASAYRLLTGQFQTQDLRGFGCENLGAAIGAAGALLQFVQETQKSALPHLTGLRTEMQDESLILDAATRRNLEIDRSLSGLHDFTLLSVMDRCVTHMGSRALHRWLTRPLRQRATLDARYQAIARLLDDGAYNTLRDALKDIADIERILARIALRSARPRDLHGLSQSLGALPGVRAALTDVEAPLITELEQKLGQQPELTARLRVALADNPPLLVKDGGVFRAGYDAALDQLRTLSENADGYLLDLETRERARSGIDSLKVGYNRVHGYYLETSKLHAAKIPADYTRRQTLTNAERYITEELKRFEYQVLSARDRALAREKELYEALLDELVRHLPALQNTAAAIAEL
ncbi:MAG: DNA mismatch repair protein MutS, partial [Stenotrophobium sp.]